MEAKANKTIYTIGHSTHSIAHFVEMLQSFDIKLLVDIRHFPGSRKFPHFNKENLEIVLPKSSIAYIHLLGLGGRRKIHKDSHNTRWRNESFRSYADYMETLDFENAVLELQSLALMQRTAYMCSEALWWRCHRSMVSDYLKAKGWEVLHIMGIETATPHKFTEPARVVGDKVFYSDEELF